MTHEDYMREAMKEAEQAVVEGNAPFGVVVVDNETGEIIARDHDRVKEYSDPTAHGEINAIRTLCKKLQTLSLRNTTFYTTSEPCPTCLTGMIKAKVSKNFYGAETELTASLPLKAVELAKHSKKYPIEITGGILADDVSLSEVSSNVVPQPAHTKWRLRVFLAPHIRRECLARRLFGYFN